MHKDRASLLFYRPELLLKLGKVFLGSIHSVNWFLFFNLLLLRKVLTHSVTGFFLRFFAHFSTFEKLILSKCSKAACQYRRNHTDDHTSGESAEIKNFRNVFLFRSQDAWILMRRFERGQFFLKTSKAVWECGRDYTHHNSGQNSKIK